MATANNESAKNTQSKERLVKVRIPKTKELQDDVFISVNNRTWLVQRGVEVELPECAAEVLLHQQEMIEEAMAFEEELTKPKKH